MAGPLALVGSGEFTSAMRDVDASLLDIAEAAGFDRVVAVIPTAAAPDGDRVVARWLSKARDHYAALDAEVLEVDVRDRTGATDLGHVADVEASGFVYLSGGKPDHLTATLRDTPLLDAVLERWRLGAALAGCSAGAMTLAAGWPPFMRSTAAWGHGLAVLPDLGLVPHFDRVRRMTMGSVTRAAKAAPDGWRTIGVDEDTALVHDGTGWATHGDGASWDLTLDGAVPLDHATLLTPR